MRQRRITILNPRLQPEKRHLPRPGASKRHYRKCDVTSAVPGGRKRPPGAGADPELEAPGTFGEAGADPERKAPGNARG